MKKTTLKNMGATLACIFLLAACEPASVAVGAGAVVGVAAMQEGGLRTAATDQAIELKIKDLWLKHDWKMLGKLSAISKEGRVLLTGNVKNADQRVDAVRLAWQAEGVRQVINEITVDQGAGFTGFVKDGWITTNLKTKLTFDKYIQSINYNVDTVGGNVYLMGIAQSRAELDRVIEHARNIRRVSNVVSYVRLPGEEPAGVMEPVTRH